MTNAFKGARGLLTLLVLGSFALAARAIDVPVRAWQWVKGRLR